MKGLIRKLSKTFFSGVVVIVACSNMTGKANDAGEESRGVHFKIDGKQYDIPVVRGIYDKTTKVFAVYNNGLPGAPDTTITISVGTNFTGGSGTFKSDVNDKGFVFGFILFNGSLRKDPVCGYGAGQNDSNSGETVAGTPVSITITHFSVSGSPAAPYGNVTAQGTFSGTAYNLKTRKTVALTDGMFKVHP
jgi:hypothetical protein